MLTIGRQWGWLNVEYIKLPWSICTHLAWRKCSSVHKIIQLIVLVCAEIYALLNDRNILLCDGNKNANRLQMVSPLKLFRDFAIEKWVVFLHWLRMIWVQGRCVFLFAGNTDVNKSRERKVSIYVQTSIFAVIGGTSSLRKAAYNRHDVRKIDCD